MERRRTKKDIVRMLLRNNELEEQDEEELLNLLIDQPIAIDVDKQEEAKMTRGDRFADKLSEVAGSWTFILIFVLFLLAWIVLNTVVLTSKEAIDPYPFILLNLVLSCISALQAPIIMMSQNRQAEKDSLRNQNDYRTVSRCKNSKSGRFFAISVNQASASSSVLVGLFPSTVINLPNIPA